MTKREMTELFSVMMLAWPNAEMFRGGIAKLGPTIELWTRYTTHVDAWIVQQAVISLCETCKFPPTIAEFREQIKVVIEQAHQQYSMLLQQIRCAEMMYGSLRRYVQSLPPGCFASEVIARMGGPDSLVIVSEHDGRRCEMWNIQGLKDACYAVMRGWPALADGCPSALKPRSNTWRKV